MDETEGKLSGLNANEGRALDADEHILKEFK